MTQQQSSEVIVKITHHTKYFYSDPVFLEPHTLRFTPRTDFSVQVIQTALTVKPNPQGFTESLDQDGNLAHVVWFNELAASLEVYSEVVVRLGEYNPYDFIIYPSYGSALPMSYSETLRPVLAPVLPSGEIKTVIKEYALRLAEESQWQTVEFLGNLVKNIQQDFRYQHREVGSAHSPVKTFETKSGSCRDLVRLAMEICGAVGIASRFVSGYYIDESFEEQPELHAWMEVYIPGAGWRGFDPTHGIACYGRHIVLAASTNPVLTACVSGSYRGKAQSTMAVNLDYTDMTKPA